MRLRTVLGGLGLVALIPLGCLSLLSPSRVAAGAWYSAALAALTVALVALPYRRGRDRAFWLGFAACGWPYLILTSFPILDTHIGVHLVTTGGLDLLYAKVAHRPPSTGPFDYSAWSDWTDRDLNFDRRYVGTVVLVSSRSFQRIGHTLMALLLAATGGLVARRFCATQRRDDP